MLITKRSIFLLLLCSVSLHARELSVQVREAKLRATPSYLGRILASLPYTARVTLIAEQGDWLNVKTPENNATGWMHQSALTKKKLALTAGEEQATQSVTTDEQALAGKGFNSQVEAQFQKRNQQTAFALVDKMEKRSISLSQIQAFLQKGDLVANTEEGSR